MEIRISIDRQIAPDLIIDLYRSVKWSAADKPRMLILALENSHTMVTAWHDKKLVGLGNSISDGYLVVYFPHLLVHPEYQGYGVGRLIMEEFEKRYNDFHMQMITADGDSVRFYKKQGFEIAGDTVPMWKYSGEEH